MKPETDNIFAALSRSKFRRRFKLGPKEQQYLDTKGMAAIEAHACDFITQRLAPAQPAHDSKQTPMRNHPVFIAQHATATCCRSCLQKWHKIPKGQPLTPEQIDYIVSIISRWLQEHHQP